MRISGLRTDARWWSFRRGRTKCRVGACACWNTASVMCPALIAPDLHHAVHVARPPSPYIHVLYRGGYLGHNTFPGNDL
eukprot:738829-Prymnesium_polylepis.1